MVCCVCWWQSVVVPVCASLLLFSGSSVTVAVCCCCVVVVCVVVGAEGRAGNVVAPPFLPRVFWGKLLLSPLPRKQLEPRRSRCRCLSHRSCCISMAETCLVEDVEAQRMLKTQMLRPERRDVGVRRDPSGRCSMLTVM